MTVAKHRLAQAMALSGFDHWRSPVDVPHLHRPFTRPEGLPGNGRVAAVLLLLYPNGKQQTDLSTSSGLELNLVLTKRNATLSHHAGQISFPGGRQEEGESLWQTATREAFEEIGVGGIENDPKLGQIELIGQLNPVYIPPSDFTVSPFVGWLDSRPEFVCAADEVEEVIEVELPRLLDPATLKLGQVVTADQRQTEVPFYQVGEHRVWGATAIMLSELLERISRSSPNQF